MPRYWRGALLTKSQRLFVLRRLLSSVLMLEFRCTIQLVLISASFIFPGFLKRLLLECATGLASICLTLVNLLAIDRNRIDQNQAPFDQSSPLLLPCRTSGIWIADITFIGMSVGIGNSERDTDLAAFIHSFLHAFDQGNGFFAADPKVKVGVVRLVRRSTQSAYSASEERFRLAATARGSDPTNTAEIAETRSVQVEKLALLCVLHGDLQSSKFGQGAQAHATEPGGLDGAAVSPSGLQIMLSRSRRMVLRLSRAQSLVVPFGGSRFEDYQTATWQSNRC